MSERFNNKDYGEYFSALEKRLEKSLQNTKSTQPKTQSNQKASKKVYGGVIRFRSWVCVTAALLVVVLVIIIALPKKAGAEQQTPSEIQSTENTVSDVKDNTDSKVNYFAEFTDETQEIASDIVGGSVIVVNCQTNKIVASRNATERCYPASTTKIMTVLTAVDYITDYSDTFTFSYEITDPLYIAEATVAGFADGEAVNMTDMLYGAILPSGADATVGLALALAGSEEEFVKLMNKKAKQLGLRDTNFTNTSGLFDKNHYTTAEDMAVIIRAASKNELCRKILSTYQYTTSATPQHPEGIPLTSTLFSYMYGTEPEGSDILGGKTGFVNEAGYCIASFGKSDKGTEYICVTFKGAGLWPTVYDQIHLYTRYAK